MDGGGKMFGVLFTVVCYTISSLGDKYISSKLKCSPAEFAFIVSFATMLWIGVTFPFMGWGFQPNIRNGVVLLLLVLWKMAEFYTSALLLKTVSAYELKAWLGINIICSYFYNVFCGMYHIDIRIIFCSAILLLGIIMIMRGREKTEQILTESFGKLCVLFLLFILSKLLYGLTINQMTEDCKATSVLFLVMFFVALLQLPHIHVKELIRRKGAGAAALTRLPNAGGLIFEAFVAMENIFLYSMIQPVQLALLFAASLIQKEPMGKMKFWGSLLCIFSVCAITVLIYY